MRAFKFRPVAAALLLAAFAFGVAFPSTASAAGGASGEQPKEVLAAQIRTQGIVCDKALRATRDVRRSKPDHEVWTLQCSNATYRVGRYPDMLAKVEQLR
jgi:hypothetical protein